MHLASVVSMPGQLPPHQQHSAPSQTSDMNPGSVRLPGIAEMISLAASAPPHHTANPPSDARWDSVPPAPVRSTPLASPPLQHQFESPAASSNPNRASWTAINRLGQNSSHVFAAAPSALVLSSHRSLAASLPDGPSGQSAHHQPSNALQRPSHHWNRHSPQNPQREPASKERPIRAPRQDSAVSESQASLASPSFQERPTSPYLPSSYVGGSPEPHQPSVGWNAVTHPKTPPSPAPSPVPWPISAQSHPPGTPSQSTGHDRGRASPPAIRSQELRSDHLACRARAHSDSERNPSSLPNLSAISPRRIQSNHRPADGSMPPPPNPFSTTSGSAPNLQTSNNGSCSRSAAPSSIQRSPTAEASISDVRQLRSPSPAPQHNCPSQQYAPDSTGTALSLDLGNPTQTRCLHCNDVWTYPLPDFSGLQQRPSKTIDELNWSTDRMFEAMQQHRAKKEQAFAEWSRFHQIIPGDPPCMVQNGMVDSSSMGSKRKSDVPGDDGQISSKLRKLSCNSPSPKLSQLTPPPEPASTSPPHNPVVPERLHPYGGDQGVYINDRVATLVKLEGAPAPQFERPANDASNMWFEPSRERRSATSEHLSNGTSVLGTEQEPIRVEADQQEHAPRQS